MLNYFISPAPTVSWVRYGATPLPSGRNVIGNYNTELTIRKVEPSDEGKYICKASNDQRSESVTIEVDVQGECIRLGCLFLHNCLQDKEA